MVEKGKFEVGYRFRGTCQPPPAIASLYYVEEKENNDVAFKSPAASFDLCFAPPFIPSWGSRTINPRSTSETYQRRYEVSVTVADPDALTFVLDSQESRIDYSYSGPGTPFERRANDIFVLPRPDNIGTYASVADAENEVVQDNVWQPASPEEDPGDRTPPFGPGRVWKDKVLAAWVILDPNAWNYADTKAKVGDPLHSLFLGGDFIWRGSSAEIFTPTYDFYPKNGGFLKDLGFPFGSYRFQFTECDGWNGDWNGGSHLVPEGSQHTGSSYGWIWLGREDYHLNQIRYKLPEDEPSNPASEFGDPGWDGRIYTLEEIWGKGGIVETTAGGPFSIYCWPSISRSLYTVPGGDYRNWTDRAWRAYYKTSPCSNWADWESLLDAGYTTQAFVHTAFSRYSRIQVTSPECPLDGYYFRQNGANDVDYLVFRGWEEDLPQVESALQSFVSAHATKNTDIVYVGEASDYSGCSLSSAGSPSLPPPGPPELEERFFNPTYRGRFAQVKARIQVGDKVFETEIPGARFFHRLTEFEVGGNSYPAAFPAMADIFDGKIDMISGNEAVVRVFHSPIREWHPGKRAWTGILKWSGGEYEPEYRQSIRDLQKVQPGMDESDLLRAKWVSSENSYDYATFGAPGGYYDKRAFSDRERDISSGNISYANQDPIPERANPKLDRYDKMIYCKVAISGGELIVKEQTEYTYPNLPPDDLPDNHVGSYTIFNHEVVGLPETTANPVYPDDVLVSGTVGGEVFYYDPLPEEAVIHECTIPGARAAGGVPFFLQRDMLSQDFLEFDKSLFPEFITPRSDWTEVETIIWYLLGGIQCLYKFKGDGNNADTTTWDCFQLSAGKGLFENSTIKPQPGFLFPEFRWEFSPGIVGWGRYSWLEQYNGWQNELGLDKTYFTQAFTSEFLRGDLHRKDDGSVIWTRIRDSSLQTLYYYRGFAQDYG